MRIAIAQQLIIDTHMACGVALYCLFSNFTSLACGTACIGDPEAVATQRNSIYHVHRGSPRCLQASRRIDDQSRDRGTELTPFSFPLQDPCFALISSIHRKVSRPALFVLLIYSEGPRQAFQVQTVLLIRWYLTLGYTNCIIQADRSLPDGTCGLPSHFCLGITSECNPPSRSACSYRQNVQL